MTKNTEHNDIQNYLKETEMLDYNTSAIQNLIHERGFQQLDTYHKIEQIYSFVQNEILFGYNKDDSIPASQVLEDGIGQCNTKATLLMALLRGVGVPCRFHAFALDHVVQKGVVPPLLFPLTPKRILHTWAEVWYEEKWVVLEGVILDQSYLQRIQQRLSVKYQQSFNPSAPIPYTGYGIATDDLYHPPVLWNGQNTYIQSKGILSDYGIFSCPDQFFANHSQALRPWKRFIYQHRTRHTMTKRVDQIRKSVLTRLS